MMRRVRFLYNPLSGRGAILRHVEPIRTLYREAGYALDCCEMEFSGDGRRLVDGLDGEYDHLLLAGGDGTVNYVANVLHREGVDLPLALIPAGTANDFAAAIGMDSHPVQAARQVLEGSVRCFDRGVVGDRVFVNVFSFGLFTTVSQHTPNGWKNRLGRAAYIMGGLQDLLHAHHIPLEVRSDGGDWAGSALMMLVFNGRSAGSFRIASMAEMDDGLLEALILRSDSLPTTVYTFMRYLTGLAGERPPSGVVHLRCRRIEIAAERAEPTDVDGQPGPPLPVSIRCEAGALRLRAPFAGV